MPSECDKSYCGFCARAVVDRLQKARALVPAVGKGKDVEAVHDLRVASRRLRTALSMLECCLGRAANWRKRAKTITRSLGQARDLDVQLEFVTKFANSASTRKKGLEPLTDYLQKQRKKAQNKVEKALDKITREKLLVEMDRDLRPLAGPSQNGFSCQALRQAGRQVLPLLEDLLGYKRFVRQASAVAEHHQMRIAAKHLRYALEIFEPMLGKHLRPALDAARRLQTLLGELHDCDVWISFLPAFLACRQIRAFRGKAPPAEELGRAVAALRDDRRRRRQALYRQFVALWTQLEKGNTWDLLREAVLNAPNNPPPNPPRKKPKAGKKRSP